MKAAVLFETGKPLRVLEGITVPTLLPGQVLVKVLYSGLCHSQLMEVRGLRGEDKYLPHLLGHEGVGEVLEVGDKVTKIAVGDKVVLGWIRGSGEEAPGALYQYQGQTLNSGGVTTFSDVTVVSENRLVRLPEGIPDKLAVLLGCALPTGLGLVFNEAKLEENKQVAVFGLGGIGLSALIAAKSKGTKTLIAVDIAEHKLELAKELGATHTINSANEDVVERINQICPGGVDNSFEAGGRVETIEQAFASVKDGGGLCVFASHPKEGELMKLEPHAFHRGKRLQGSWGGGSKPDKDIPLFVDLYKQGNLQNIEKLLSNEYTLQNINDALDDLEQGKITRALIVTE